MKKKVLALFLAMTMVLSMTACSSSDTSVTEESAATEEAVEEVAEEEVAEEVVEEATESASEETMTISLLCHQFETNIGVEAYTTAFFACLEEWEAAHPGVDVVVESMDQTSYQTKINALGASDDMPDVFLLKGSWTKTFVENGWVVDLTDELEADGWKDNFLEGTFDAGIYEGSIYGAPLESMSTGVVFYNTEMWSSIGYDTFPETWDELLDAVDKFNAEGITPFVMGNQANWPAESCWLSTLGDRYTGAAWTQSILDGTGASFTDDSFVAALTTFQELAEVGGFNADINSLDDSEQNTVYFNEGAAAIVNGTWFISTVTNTAPDNVLENTALAILPSVEGGADVQNTVSGGPAWFMSMSNSVTDEKHDLVVDLIKYLTGEEQASIAASYGGITSWANPDYDQDSASDLFNEYYAMMENVETVQIYDASMDASVIETMNVGLQSLLIGAITPEELAEEIQLEYELSQ